MGTTESLRFVVENSPAWIDRLDELTAQIATRQLELSELASRPLKQRHASTESLRPKANLDDVETRLEQHNPELVRQAREHQARQLRRKRKTGSIASNGSGASTYRTRSMIIVYYDSAVQEAFEMIVRSIGTARNNIRKGKMAAKLKQMTAVVDDMDSDPDSVDNFRAKIAYTRTTKPKGAAAQNVYEQIDLGLDFAQAQCERAAHQFLRDGDCAEEILLIRNKALEITSLAAEELERDAENERKLVEAEEKKRKKKAEEETQHEAEEVEEGNDKEKDGSTGAVPIVTAEKESHGHENVGVLEVDPDI